MSKYLKSFIVACLVACMTVCLGIFAAACTDKPAGGGKDTFPSSVSVTVKTDASTPAVGVAVQLCAVKDNGKLGLCLTEQTTNAQGVATIPVEEKNGKKYEIHLANLPEGYDYVDSNDNSYTEAEVAAGSAGKGIQIDVTKNSTPTITLKAKSAPDTTHTIGLDVETAALWGHSYVFTAPAEGYYLFTCDAISGWSLNDEDQWGNEKTIQLDNGATATVTIKYDSDWEYDTDSCTLKVENGQAPVLGTEDNPLVLTLGGDAANFSVNLEERIDRNGQPDETGKMPTMVAWGIDGFIVTFTTDVAGKYKITITSTVENDDVSAYVTATDYSDYPKISDGGSGNTKTSTGTLLASTEYTVSLESTKDYTGLVDEGTTSLSYTVKVEYVADGGDDEGGDDEYDEIVLGQTYECDSTIYKLVVKTTGNYTFTVIDDYANLYNLAVAKSLDNIDYGDIVWTTDPNTGNPGSTETVELEAGTYYVIGYDMGEFTVTIPQATTD